MAEGTFQIAGRGVVRGCAQGEALVADATLSFWGEVDAVTGRVIAVGHPLEGASLAGRVLIIRSTKGSSGTPMVLRLASLEGNAPAAMVNVEVDGLAALGCIVNEIPMITDLERDPFAAISTGDVVTVDADRGIVIVAPKRPTEGCENAGEA
jgi:predicted aconitase with swiveling domain